MEDYCAKVLCASILLLASLVGAFNIAVDPEGQWNWGFQERFKPFRHVPTMSATAKLALLDRTNCRRILVGSSRVEFALDPSDPHWSDRKTCNLGISGSSIRDQMQVVRRALSQGKLTELVWGLDFASFSKNFPDLLPKPVERGRLPLLDEFSWKRIVRSAKLFKSYWKGERNGYDDSGFLSRPPFRAMALTRFRNDLRDYSSEYALYRGYELDFEALEEFSRLLKSLQSEKIAFRLTILPVHVLHSELIRRLELQKVYDRWITALIERTGQPLFDFVTYGFPNQERIPPLYQKMRWFWDSNHITAQYGGVLIEEMSSARPQLGRVWNTQAEYLEAEKERLRLREEWIANSKQQRAEVGL